MSSGLMTSESCDERLRVIVTLNTSVDSEPEIDEASNKYQLTIGLRGTISRWRNYEGKLMAGRRCAQVEDNINPSLAAVTVKIMY